MLKDLPKGRTFTMKLTEPRKAFGKWTQLTRWLLGYGLLGSRMSEPLFLTVPGCFR